MNRSKVIHLLLHRKRDRAPQQAAVPWGVGETQIPQVGAERGLAITPDGATAVVRAAALVAGRAAEAALAGVGAGATVPLVPLRARLAGLGALHRGLQGPHRVEAHRVDEIQMDSSGWR